MAQPPAGHPSAPELRSRGALWCGLTGLGLTMAASVLGRVVELPFPVLVLPLLAAIVGLVVARSVQVSPRTAGVSFLAGALVWVLFASSGILLLFLPRLLFGGAMAVLSAGLFATAIAWRRPRSAPALPRS